MSHFKKFCEEKGVKITCKFQGEASDNGWMHRAWTCKLRYQGRQMTVPFRMGMDLEEPSVEGVIACLLLDTAAGSSNTFEEFAHQFGYDTDSRTAEAVWKKCRQNALKLRRFLQEDFAAFEEAASGY